MVGLFIVWLRSGLAVSASCSLLTLQKDIAAWMAQGCSVFLRVTLPTLSIPAPQYPLFRCPLDQPGSLGPSSPQWGNTQFWGKAAWLRAWTGAEVTGRRKQPPSCLTSLLQRLPRAGWRWATCACLLTTCELSCIPMGIPSGLPARACCSSVQSPAKQGLRWERTEGQAGRAVPAAGPRHTHTGPIVGHGDTLALGRQVPLA